MEFLIGARQGRAREKVSRFSCILCFASTLVFLVPLGCYAFKTDVAASSPSSPFQASIRADSSSSSLEELPVSVQSTLPSPSSAPEGVNRGVVEKTSSRKIDSSPAARESAASSSPHPSLFFSLSVPASSRSDSGDTTFAVSGERGAADEEPQEASMSSTAGPNSDVDHALFVVPGIAGSGLFATVTNASFEACGKSPINYAVPFRVWASLSLLLPPVTHQRCWVEMMKMTVDENGETYTAQEGVHVEVDGYGGIHAIDYLDYYMNNTYGVPASAYMHGMLRTLLSLHYAQFVTLRGVPYDWRLPPWQLNYAQLKADIEDRYTELNNRKVDLIAHSLGSIILCYFLNRVVDQAWKDKYIGSMTLVAAATGGSFKAVKSLLSGYDDGTDIDIWNVIDFSLFPAVLLRDLLQTMGSIYALLPDPAVYGRDHVVVRVARPPTRVPALSSAAASPSQSPAGRTAGGASHVAERAKDPISNLSASSGEMRRRLDAVVTDEAAGQGSRARDRESEQSFSRVSDLARDSLDVEKELAEGETNTRVDRSPVADSVGEHMEEEALAKAEERREALLREFQLQNRLSHEDRAARQRERYSLFVEKEKRRLDEALRVAKEEGLEEDVYTLSNWTSLLPADLQRRVKTAQDMMAGVVADPGVPVRCIWSKFTQPTTDVAYYYASGSFDSHPIPIFDYGDNTVPLPSLSLCASWRSTVQVKAFDNLDHMFLFADRGFNSYIYDLFTPNPQQSATALSTDEGKATKHDGFPAAQESRRGTVAATEDRA
ncbi:putative 1-O-acylceramide synthase [Neospora caninum Liverpool]|uniref:1-O-acylceramide synthase, putative n=1 Tax=Neospora caninum (strain Liverpool) TaxID=572307 RepID=F0VIZ6_NEOCL|nr:putative 1-O-acylceramide synthase [Neospora caninum Liverpool]CBZ53707.1 putative 1-O-acylceramide synthase [Neospora caninum Liverpool]CEL67697.1 TPA: 1-O-acylceramide synthase, putative [Neospora caninum Liverpool]|eukprot:XP_003883739.1 putative 1-O-acylceramide synthase [Neospora caninum Liverpool]